MLSHLEIREACRISNKDVGSLDNCCFQIIHETEIITLRVTNVSEKRQWMNQIEAAIKLHHTKANKKSVQKHNSGVTSTIGTLNVLLMRAYKLGFQTSFKEVFAVVRVGEQILKSKIVNEQSLVFNQPLIFKISSLDDVLQLSLYKYDKYSVDAYLGQAEIQLDFLEYYGGKETELIQLPMKDGVFEKIDIKLVYRLV
jgi:hypothetical protein